MATKTMGHLGVATGTAADSGSACNMTTINGAATACDFSAFDCIMFTSITCEPDIIAIDGISQCSINFLSYGSRYLSRIGGRTANFTWYPEYGYVEESTNHGYYCDFFGASTGADIVYCDYNNGGYNNNSSNTGYLEASM